MNSTWVSWSKILPPTNVYFNLFSINPTIRKVIIAFVFMWFWTNSEKMYNLAFIKPSFSWHSNTKVLSLLVLKKENYFKYKGEDVCFRELIFWRNSEWLSLYFLLLAIKITLASTEIKKIQGWQKLQLCVIN